MTSSSKLPEILRRHETEILTDWLRQQQSSSAAGKSVAKESDLREQSRGFLAAFREGLDSGGVSDAGSPVWTATRDFIADISRSRARQGVTPSETATFILSLKLPVFARLRQEYGSDAAGLAADVWTATELLDR